MNILWNMCESSFERDGYVVSGSHSASGCQVEMFETWQKRFEAEFQNFACAPKIWNPDLKSQNRSERLSSFGNRSRMGDARSLVTNFKSRILNALFSKTISEK